MIATLALKLLAIGSSRTTPPFPLLEASGSATGSLVAVGRLCGGADSFAALVNATTGELVVLRGPTPHVAARFALPELKDARSVLAVNVAPGGGADELVVGVGTDVLVVAFTHVDNNSCTAASVVSRVSGTGSAALAPLPAVDGLDGVLTVSETGARPFAELRWDSGELHIVNTSSLGLPAAALKGCSWSGAGATAAQLVVACAEPAPKSGEGHAVRTFAYAATDLARPLANRTVALVAPLLQLLVADVYGDGAPLGLLVDALSNAEMLWLTAGEAPLASAGRFTFEPNATAARKWRSVAAGRLLSTSDGHTLPAESQILALREPVGNADFEISMLLYARPNHWLRRAASFSNLRATQV